MVPKETGNNAYAKFWRNKQRVLWYFWKWPIGPQFFPYHSSNIAFSLAGLKLMPPLLWGPQQVCKADMTRGCSVQANWEIENLWTTLELGRRTILPTLKCLCQSGHPAWIHCSPGACFSKVLKLFGPISGATIPFISWQCWGNKPSNFPILLLFLTLKTCSLSTDFLGLKTVLRMLEKQTPGLNWWAS